MSDNTNEQRTSKAPNYYEVDGVEAKDIIEIASTFIQGNTTFNIPAHHFFYIGNILKYLLRYSSKGMPLKDLYKAQDYLKFLINETLQDE